MLDATASKKDGFILRDICISSTQLNRIIWNKESLSPLWKIHVAGSIPLKN
jgi:hypothetical protein